MVLSMLAFTNLAVSAVAADLQDLVEALGRPRSAAGAIAQNTSIVQYSAGLCGLAERARKYKVDQAKVIDRTMAEGYGANREREVKRIAKEVDVWWFRKDVTDAEKRRLCQLADNSLKQLGY
jgi:hypothetical protein